MEPTVSIRAKYKFTLNKGENSYQIPAELYIFDQKDPLSFANLELISGESPGFTNLCGIDRLIHTLTLTSQTFHINAGKAPFIVVAAKHGNPCGLAIDWQDPVNAVKKALWGNPVSIWGGEVIANFDIDQDIANSLFHDDMRGKVLGSSGWMLDIIIAPKFSSEAIKILGERKRRKLIQNSNLLHPSLNPNKKVYRFVRGGLITQPPHNFVLDLKNTEFVGTASRQLNPQVRDSLLIAWATAFSSNHGGNEVALAKDLALISCGGGPSTIEAAQFALIKAKNQKHTTKGSVFAADAFLPFTDVPKVLAKAGVIAGTVPAGGTYFDTIKSYFRKKKISVFYIPEKYRGFCWH